MREGQFGTEFELIVCQSFRGTTARHPPGISTVGMVRISLYSALAMEYFPWVNHSPAVPSPRMAASHQAVPKTPHMNGLCFSFLSVSPREPAWQQLPPYPRRIQPEGKHGCSSCTLGICPVTWAVPLGETRRGPEGPYLRCCSLSGF